MNLISPISQDLLVLKKTQLLVVFASHQSNLQVFQLWLHIGPHLYNNYNSTH